MAWVTQLKVGSEYNANNQVISFSEYRTITETNMFEGTIKYTKEYDIDNRDSLFYYYKWDNLVSDWSNLSKTEYYYSMVTSVEKENQMQISVYPNPFQDQLFFELNDNSGIVQFELYDLQGKLIHRQDLSGNLRFTYNSLYLDKGIYLYRILGEKFQQSGKLIKK